MIQYILAFSEAEIVGVYQNMKNNKDLRRRKRSLKVVVNSEIIQSLELYLNFWKGTVICALRHYITIFV